MSTLHEPATHTPTAMKGGHTPSTSEMQKSKDVRQKFVFFALNMSWQLAVVVLLPVIGGVELDKTMKTTDVFTIAGLIVALIGSGLILWITAIRANRLPVPKLTEEQKRVIQKSYEAEDDD